MPGRGASSTLRTLSAAFVDLIVLGCFSNTSMLFLSAPCDVVSQCSFPYYRSIKSQTAIGRQPQEDDHGNSDFTLIKLPPL